MENKSLVQAAVMGILALGLTSAQNAVAAKEDMEKCAGVVKAGKNDCGTSAHACAGQGKADSDKNEWTYLPKGTCEKLVGGTVVAAKADAKKSAY